MLSLRRVSNAGSDYADGDTTALPAVSGDVLGSAQNDNL
jgi:hypothetical protein